MNMSGLFFWWLKIFNSSAFVLKSTYLESVLLIKKETKKTKHVFLQTNYEKLQLIQTIIRHTYKN